MVRYAGLIGVTLLSRGMGPECGTRAWVTGCQVWFSLRVLGRCFMSVWDGMRSGLRIIGLFLSQILCLFSPFLELRDGVSSFLGRFVKLSATSATLPRLFF